MEDKKRTLYCGNLSEKVTEDILYELFLQAGPLENVTVPKDKDGHARGFAFIAFKHPVSVQYAVALMDGISLYGRSLRLDPRSGSNEDNPYLQKLRQHQNARMGAMHHNSQGYYPQNDNRYHSDNRYQQLDTCHNSRSEPRINYPHNSPPVYPAFNPPFFSRQMSLPPPVNNHYNSTPNRYDDYRGSRSGYNRY